MLYRSSGGETDLQDSITLAMCFGESVTAKDTGNIARVLQSAYGGAPAKLVFHIRVRHSPPPYMPSPVYLRDLTRFG